MTGSVHYLCKGCEWRLTARAQEQPTPCENCGGDAKVIAPQSNLPLDRCGACGGTALYVQKDFNRTTGLVLVGIGAVFVPWTYGLSLLAVTIIDLALYYKLKNVTVCYACQAVHRGYPPNSDHKPFDLVIHDRHIYGAAPPGAEEGHS